MRRALPAVARSMRHVLLTSVVFILRLRELRRILGVDALRHLQSWLLSTFEIVSFSLFSATIMAFGMFEDVQDGAVDLAWVAEKC